MQGRLDSMFKLDKEKYLTLLRTQGVNAAITQLHRDTERWEYNTFEGEKGWSPDDWEALKEVRVFSRQLWDESLKNA